MMTTRCAITAALICCTTPAFAKDELCPKAYTWFSCGLDNGKTVAICGSASREADPPTFVADDDSWLQYRYGTADNIELLYPDNLPKNEWGYFLGGITFGPGGTADRINLSFITDGIRYLIQGNQVPFEGRMDYALLVVDENTVKTLAEHRCTAPYDHGLLAITNAVPCDPNDTGNDTRGDTCQ